MSDPFAKAVYQLPHFELFNKPPQLYRVSTESLDITSVVGYVGDVPIAYGYFLKLDQLAKTSQVGLGRATLNDELTRKSREISGDKIRFEPVFFNFIETKAKQMALSLGHPTEVSLKVHKLILYKESDYFEEHIDNEHVENMIMTLSVALPTKNLVGGNLIFGTDGLHQVNDKLTLVQFYHDTKHQVSPVESGYRLVLTFDVIQNPQKIIMPLNLDAFKEGLEKLRKRGIKRIGYPANHLYCLKDGETMTYAKLKGLDRIFYEVCRMNSLTPEIEKIACIKDEGICYQSFVNLLKEGGALGIVYLEQDKEKQESGHYQISVKEGYEQIVIPEKGGYEALNPKYSLHNTVILNSSRAGKITYSADSEVYLGNEGFSGEIYENVALFSEI